MVRKLRPAEFKSCAQDHIAGFGPTPSAITLIAKCESRLASGGAEGPVPSLEDLAGWLPFPWRELAPLVWVLWTLGSFSTTRETRS